MKDNIKKKKKVSGNSRPSPREAPPPPADEEYFDDYWEDESEPDPEEERERYYTQRDAYYAERDAWYAKRDAYYARKKQEEEESTYWNPPPASKPVRSGKAPARRRRRRRRKGRFFRTLLLLVLLGAVAAMLLGKPPVSGGDGAAGERIPGRSNILLAGVDRDGTRTDTIMLLSLDRSAQQVRLLSIPRDTYTPDYPVPKINSAYGAAGGGQAGMEALSRQCEKLLGFAPDAYVLIDLDCFVQAVDMLGGLDFDVPQDMYYEDWTQDLLIDLRAGMQHLDGEQLLGLVRFRAGYPDADIGRTAVQRNVMRAALIQWLRPDKLKILPELWKLYEENMVTNLSRRNLLWIARVLVKADAEAMSTGVLPGYSAMIGGASCYVMDQNAAARILADYDPYR